MESWRRSSYARAMIELRVDVEWKDTMVVAMPKLVDKCPNEIVSDVVKNLYNPRQAVRGTNEGILKSAGKRSLYVAPGSSSTTPIAERIDKLKRQILDVKLMFVNDDGKSLYKADSTVR
ncbi:hypothetical protein Tco_0137954 [Tanacetum coccineum]